jgi:hypothetical protein
MTANVIRDWTMPLDEEDRALLARTRRQFAECCAEMTAALGDPDAAARAIGTHLGSVSNRVLPPAAQTIWSDRVARPLKTDAAKVLPQRAVAAIRALPARRIAELATALSEITAILVETENEALHEVIYAEISRTYS